jgi:hypothetical protein
MRNLQATKVDFMTTPWFLRHAFTLVQIYFEVYIQVLEAGKYETNIRIPPTDIYDVPKLARLGQSDQASMS